jgi:hypothetical protein
MPQKEKTIFDHITDWFRELKVLGVSGLLVGLGFIVVFITAILYSSNPTVGFWVVIAIGALMIVLGAYIKILEVKRKR